MSHSPTGVFLSDSQLLYWPGSIQQGRRTVDCLRWAVRRHMVTARPGVLFTITSQLPISACLCCLLWFRPRLKLCQIIFCTLNSASACHCNGGTAERLPSNRGNWDRILASRRRWLVAEKTRRWLRGDENRFKALVTSLSETEFLQAAPSFLTIGGTKQSPPKKKRQNASFSIWQVKVSRARSPGHAHTAEWVVDFFWQGAFSWW